MNDRMLFVDGPDHLTTMTAPDGRPPAVWLSPGQASAQMAWRRTDDPTRSTMTVHRYRLVGNIGRPRTTWLYEYEGIDS